ncbi:hypothetical protein FRC12_015877 [Ceratobasidium sp. 428]|nr:hypothetical protein FRC12_015877 [Ceratobasidium sp. 428]
MRRHHRTRHNSNTPDQEAARIFEAKLKIHVRDNPECQWEYDWYRNTLKKSIRRSRVQIDQQVAKKAESGQPLCDKFMRELEKPHSYLDELSSPTLGGLLSPMSPLSPRSSYFDGAVTSDSSPEREASRAQSPARDSSVSPERSQSVHLALGGVSDPTTTVPGGFVPVVAPSAQSPETSPRVNPRTVIPNTPYNESAVSSVAPTPVLPGAFFPSSSIENSPAMRPDVIPTVPTSVPSSLGESNSTKPTIQQDVPEIVYVPEPDLDITTPRFEQPSPFDNLGRVQFPRAGDDSSRVKFPRDDAVREAVDDSTRAREIDIPIDDSSRKVDDSTGKIPRTNPVLTPHTSSQPGDHPNVLDSALGVSSLVSSNAEDHRPIVGDEPVERAPPAVERGGLDNSSVGQEPDSPPEDVVVSQPPRGPYKLPGTFQSSVQSLDPSASIDDLTIQVPSEHVEPDTARTPTEKQPGEHSSIPAAPSRGPYRLPGSFQESVQSLELGSTDDVSIQVPTELVEASVVDDAKTPTKERKHFIFSPLDEDTTVQLPKDTSHIELEPESANQDSKSTQDLDDSLVYDSEPGPELDQFPHPPPLHVPTSIDPDSQKSPTSPVVPGAYQRKFFSFTPLLPTQSLEGSSPNPGLQALPPVPAPPPPPAGRFVETRA